MWIKRPRLLDAVERTLKRSPVTALLGPRQCGQTTLAQLCVQIPAATLRRF